MENYSVYEDIANRTGGDIYVGVVGPVRTGKSTFINSLIGAEYLPQDKHRCTAKIYKIMQSYQSDRASIKFLYQETPIVINLKSDFEIVGELPIEFKDELINNILINSNSSLSKKISSLLKFLNLYDETNGKDFISDLIELEVPFNSEVFACNSLSVNFDISVSSSFIFFTSGITLFTSFSLYDLNNPIVFPP